MTYHNTTDLAGRDLSTATSRAGSQDLRVLLFFQHNSKFAFSAEEIQRIVLPDAPLTSARRAVSNLCNLGKVEKVGTTNGQFGRPVYLWKYQA